MCEIFNSKQLQTGIITHGVSTLCAHGNELATVYNLGLMSSRSKRILNRQEIFTYDHLDRLTSISTGKIGQQGTQQQEFSYHYNGNIVQNSNIGTYIYDSSKALNIAKKITTLKIKLPASGETLTKTMLITAKHKSISKLFEQEFWKDHLG